MASEQGATAVEYGLLLTLIAAVIIIAVLVLGRVTGEMFADTCNELHDGVSAAGHPASGTC
jgi:pilus assembly protein Flp/PilA